MASDPPAERLQNPLPGANGALALLLLINLFNYIDRQVLSAVTPLLKLDKNLFTFNDPDKQFKVGLLQSAFLAMYMVVAPVAGWLDGHGYRRWVILGLGVALWSLASGSSGYADQFGLPVAFYVLFLTRCLIGVGEGAYGPVSSAMLADIYPTRLRGTVMAVFNMAIPVGSALGFVIGGKVAAFYGDDWRPAFRVTYIGLILAVLCFARREFPRPTLRSAAAGESTGYFAILARLWRNRSFTLCCAGMTAITFVIGGVAATAPTYIFERESHFAVTDATLKRLAEPEAKEKRDPVPSEVIAKLAPLNDGKERDFATLKADVVKLLDERERDDYFESLAKVATTKESMQLDDITTYFGLMIVLGGLSATAFGAWAGERLRERLRGAYFWVIGVGALFAWPCYVGLLEAPFPLAWLFTFLTVFFLFLHVGPGFTILANVVTSEIRATAFAINIFVIHALGDVISPPLIGLVADAYSFQTAYWLMSALIIVGGLVWLAGVRGLERDTEAATRAEDAPGPVASRG